MAIHNHIANTAQVVWPSTQTAPDTLGNWLDRALSGIGGDDGFVHGTMAAQNADAVDITGGTITGMPTPENGSDVATKSYVDAADAGLAAADAGLAADIAAIEAALLLLDGDGDGDTASTVSTIAALRALTSVFTVADGAVLNVTSWWAHEYKGGGSFWYQASDLESEDNGGTIIVDAADRRWKRIDGNTLDFFMWGAKADGVDTGSEFTGTDNTAALQAALDYCSTHRLTLRICNGKYRFHHPADPATTALTIGTFVSIVGESAGGVQILMSETHTLLNHPYARFMDSGVAPAPYTKTTNELFHIENITFQGPWTHAYGTQSSPTANSPAAGNTGATTARVEGYSKVIVRNCKFLDIRNKGIRMAHCNSVEGTSLHFERCSQGFFRPYECNHVIVKGIIGLWGDDDFIDPMSEDDVSATPVRSSCSFSDLIMFGCEGLNVNSAKHMAVTNCLAFMTHGTCVSLGNGSPTNDSGNTATINVTLENINIMDPLERWEVGTVVAGVDSGSMNTADANRGALTIAGTDTSGDSTGNVVPGEYSPALGAFLDYFTPEGTTGDIGAMWANDSWGTVSSPGSMGYVVNNIVVQRTLPDATNYSDWGFGKMFTRDGWKNPAMTGDQFRGAGITFQGRLIGATVSNISISNMPQSGIRFVGGTEDENNTDGVYVTTNPGAGASSLDMTTAAYWDAAPTEGSPRIILDKGRRLMITASTNMSGRTLTITGTNKGEEAKVVVLNGPNATTIYPLEYWKDIATIDISAGTAGNLTIGTYKSYLDRKTAFQDILVSNFTIKNCKYPISKYDNDTVRAIADCDNWRISFNHGFIDADPLYKAKVTDGTTVIRNTDGSWDSDTTQVYRGFAMRNWKGGRVNNVTFRNVYEPFSTNHFVDVSGIKVCCSPVSTAYSATNLGVAVPGSGADYLHEIINCDRTSPTHGDVINRCRLSSDVMPTTGTFVTGHFVKNTAPALVEAGGANCDYVVTGWTRLTTGSAHVLNTDWAEGRQVAKLIGV